MFTLSSSESLSLLLQFLQHILVAVVKHTILTWLLLIDNNKLFKYLFIIALFLVVASISIIILAGISNPSCTTGDLRCFLSMTSALTTPPLKRKKPVALEIARYVKLKSVVPISETTCLLMLIGIWKIFAIFLPNREICLFHFCEIKFPRK